MSFIYNTSRSATKPDLIDTTSSKKYIYIRKDIKEIEEKIGDAEESAICYEYQEAKLTPEEYEQYLKQLSLVDMQQQRADIDYIALMSGIDLEEV